MSGLEVKIYRRDGGSEVVSPGLTYQVRQLSRRAIGGPDRAEVGVSGGEAEVWRMLETLRCPVVVYDDRAEPVWWGYVAEATVQMDGIEVGVSLEEMSNRVQVVYSEVNVAGTLGDRSETAWYEDVESLAAFGVKEAVHTLEQGTAEQAAARAQTLLGRLRYPRPTRAFGDYGAEAVGTLRLRGWWETLGWRYYEDISGKESYEDLGDGLQPFGKGVTSSTIRFELEEVAGDTVYRIRSSGKELLAFSSGEQVYVSGSVANNGTYRVGSVRDVDDAGTSDYGSYLTVTPAVTTAAAGPSVTVRTAVKLAQSFQLGSTSAWAAASVRLRGKREGTPSDNLVVDLCADSGGAPGTVLGTASLSGAVVSENLNWHEFALPSRVALALATTYWIVVRRSGGAAGEDYYKIDSSEAAGYTRGVLRVWNGSAWGARSPDADMLFQVGGVTETTEQVSKMLTAAGQFFAGVQVELASGVWACPYRDGERTALDYLTDLLTSGTSNHRRLLAAVDVNRWVRVWEEPVSGSGDYLLHRDGTLHDRLDQAIAPAQYPVGVWSRLKDVIPAQVNTGTLADADRVFVEGYTYDVERGVSYIEDRDAATLLEVG